MRTRRRHSFYRSSAPPSRRPGELQRISLEQYTPVGSIDAVNYADHRYRALSSEAAVLNNIASVKLDIGRLQLLVSARSTIPGCFERPFGAPYPILRLPTPPRRPEIRELGLVAPSLNEIDPEPTAAPRSPRSKTLSVLLPGLYHLYYSLRAWLNRKNFALNHQEWTQITAEKIRYNRELEEAFQDDVRSHPAMKAYDDAVRSYEQAASTLKAKYREQEAVWEKECARYYDDREADSAGFSALRDRAALGDDKAATAVCGKLVNSLNLPVQFPPCVSIHADARRGLLHVEMQVPSAWNVHVFEQTPRGPKSLAKRRQAASYDQFVYGLMVLIGHQLGTEPSLSAYGTLGLNAVAVFKSPASGLDTQATIASAAISREQVTDIDLEHVDPAETFRSWRGVAAAELSDLVPVQPVIAFDTKDSRIIAGEDVLSNSDELENLAEMDWQRFEHLIRQLFEMEFQASGAEVRVTRSARDRGVDAIVFDPDPIRGGKIVIQAKRYTNVVDVSAVRDLYGTVQNEGANRGILVTTSRYGKDSFEFARDKPITLLDGSNLAALLEKHGFFFRIDTAAARHNLRGTQEGRLSQRNG